MATMHMKTYDMENEEWSVQPEMRQKRKDHACIVVEISNERGILVTGGVDENDNLLNSVEFYSLTSESWKDLSSLKHGRTEHGKQHYE